MEVDILENIFIIHTTIKILASIKKLSTREQTTPERAEEIKNIIKALILWQHRVVTISYASLPKCIKQATFYFKLFCCNFCVFSHSPLSIQYHCCFCNLLSTAASFLCFAAQLLTHPSFILTATPSHNNNLFLCSAFTLVIYTTYS